MFHIDLKTNTENTSTAWS